MQDAVKKMYRFPASSISAVADRNKHKSWQEAATDVYNKYNKTEETPEECNEDDESTDKPDDQQQTKSE